MEKPPNSSLLHAMSLNDLLDKIDNNLGKLEEGMSVDPRQILYCPQHYISKLTWRRCDRNLTGHASDGQNPAAGSKVSPH